MFGLITNSQIPDYGVVRSNLAVPAYNDFARDTNLAKDAKNIIGQLGILTDEGGRKRMMSIVSEGGKGITICDKFYNPDGSMVAIKKSNTFEGNIFQVGSQYISEKSEGFRDLIENNMYQAQDFLIQNGFGDLASPSNSKKIMEMIQQSGGSKELAPEKVNSYDKIKDMVGKDEPNEESVHESLGPVID